MLKCGIVGLPLSGKSTIFNVITRAGAEVKPYAGGKTEPNRALVSVPDKRFDKLVEIFKPKSEKPADVEFVDLATFLWPCITDLATSLGYFLQLLILLLLFYY